MSVWINKTNIICCDPTVYFVVTDVYLCKLFPVGKLFYIDIEYDLSLQPILFNKPSVGRNNNEIDEYFKQIHC